MKKHYLVILNENVSSNRCCLKLSEQKEKILASYNLPESETEEIDIDYHQNLDDGFFRELISYMNNHKINTLLIYDYTVICHNILTYFDVDKLFKNHQISVRTVLPVVVAGYVRVSTAKQVRDGVSIDMQKQRMNDYAHYGDFIKKDDSVKFYCDSGYSAKNLNRPAMQKLLEDIENNRISILFSYDLSRISRDIIDTHVFLNLVDQHDVLFKTLCDNIKTDTASDRMYTNIQSSMNQYEREKISERTNAGLIQVVNEGRYPVGGKPPFGYYRDSEKNLRINESEAELIRKAVEMACNGETTEDILAYINSKQNRRIFTEGKLRNLFSDFRLCGEFRYKNRIYYNIFPAICKKEDLDKARISLKPLKKSNKVEYIFASAVFCVKDSRYMTCTYGTSHTSRHYYYYKCPECQKTISQLSLEKQIELHPPVSVSHKKTENNIKTRIKSISNRQEILKNKFIDGQLSDKEFLELNNMLAEESKNLTEELEENARYDIYPADKDIEKKKIFIKNHIKRIDVDFKDDKKTIKIIYY